MKERADGSWGVEIRNAGLDNGRLDLSLRVPRGASAGATARENKKEAERREAAVHLLVERGEWQLLRDLRAGKFQVVDLANAVRDGKLDALRRTGEGALTLGSMTARVMEEKEAAQEVGTVKHYRKVIRSLHAHFGPDADLRLIGTDEARGWLYGMKGKEPKPGAEDRRKRWAPNTQQGYHMVAAYVWRTAVHLELEAAERFQSRPRLTRNVWDNVAPAEQRTNRHSFLEPAEWMVLLERVANRPQAAFFALGCLTGLRVDEVLNLRTGIDVEWEGADPLIRIQPRDGEYAWRPKNDNSIREVPVTPAVRAILAAHAERYAGSRYFIVTSRGDRPMSYTNAVRWTSEWFRAAGFKYGREGEALTFHSLRHTFASWLVREGWSSTLVAKLMGNTSKEVERTYAHLAPKDTHRVMLTIDRLTEPGSSVESSGAPEPIPSK